MARELHLHLLMHNLVRRLMFEAACKANVPLSRISFAGGLAATRRTGLSVPSSDSIIDWSTSSGW